MTIIATSETFKIIHQRWKCNTWVTPADFPFSLMAKHYYYESLTSAAKDYLRTFVHLFSRKQQVCFDSIHFAFYSPVANILKNSSCLHEMFLRRERVRDPPSVMNICWQKSLRDQQEVVVQPSWMFLATLRASHEEGMKPCHSEETLCRGAQRMARTPIQHRKHMIACQSREAE